MWRSYIAITMAVALAKLFMLSLSIQAIACQQHQRQQRSAGEAEAILQQVKDQVMIMTNHLMTNASVISQAAEANASRLLADFYNDVNRGIADAQHNASMIGNAFQNSISKRAEEVMTRATGIYTKVQRALRDATAGVEQAIARLVNSTEHEMSKAMRPMASSAPAPTPTMGSMPKTTGSQ